MSPDAAKLCRTLDAFGHEVKATDTSERKGQVNEVDVSSISLVSGSGGYEMQAVGQPMHRRRRPIITSRSNCRIRGALAEIARTCALSEHGGHPTFALTQSARNGCFARAGLDGRGLRKLELKTDWAYSCYVATTCLSHARFAGQSDFDRHRSVFADRAN